MHKLVFEFSPEASSSLLVGILSLIKDDQVVNQIQCASSYPGMQYSGAWRQKGGLIPPGKWQVTTQPIDMPSIKGVNADRINAPSYFYQILPEVQKQSNGVIRGDFGIHYDGNAPGCFPANDVEVLTDRGWVTPWGLEKGVKVAQVLHDGTLSYKEPLEVINEHYEGKMISIESNKLSMLVTPNHRVLQVQETFGRTTRGDQGGRLKYINASDIDEETQFRVPISFINNEGGADWDVYQSQLLIAYLADGYHQNEQTCWHLRKPRKIERLKSILDGAGIAYKEYPRSDNAVEIKVSRLPFEKDIDPTLATQLSLGTRKVMLRELIYWDGTTGNSANKAAKKYSVLIASTNKSHRDFYELLAITSGFSFNDNLYKDPRNDDWAAIYRMSIVEGRRTYSLTPKEQEGSLEIREVDYSGNVFCLRTSAGNFVVKHQGKVFATGNSLGCIVARTPIGWLRIRQFMEAAAKVQDRIDLNVLYN